VAVPKRKMSRSNTRSRRANWKAVLPTVVKRTENGRTSYVVPHRAVLTEDGDVRYDGRQVL
jgi:large subunit ribosomal protein L32